MKKKIHILLPIAVSIFLPLLGLGAKAFLQKIDFLSAEFYIIWFKISLLLYLLWHLLEKGRNFFPNQKSLSLFVTALLWLLKVYLAIEVFKIFGESSLLYVSAIRLLAATILFTTIQYALRTKQDITKLAFEKKQIEAENYKTQLQALRSKVDPHFLFNTLNTLRIMIRHQHGDAEKFVMSLSDFYRQTLQYNENSTIELDKEMEVLKAYLFLMQSRNQTGLTIDINLETSIQKYLIPTLALQIVTENCLKHNTMTAAKPLHISINSVDNNYIAIRNNIQPKFTITKSLGHGLGNIQQRYKLLGIENGVKIQKMTDFFEVKLKLI